jgi:tRNA-dihydrouridine synthase B
MQQKIQLAPMLGLTDAVFINILHREIGGYQEMFLPYMVACSTSPIRESVLIRRLDQLDRQIDIVPQLLSNDSEGFLHYANLLYDLGYKKVNWNLGCPQPFVTNRGRGAGLLRNPDMIKTLLDQIIPNLKPILSIKTRLGYYSTDESIKLVELFNEYPIGELIIHARTAIQQYKGEPDQNAFINVAKMCKIPLVYNGNIICLNQAGNIINNYPDLSGIMVGRGAFINPFVGLELNEIFLTQQEKTARLKVFYQALFNEYKQRSKTEAGFLNHFKELWGLFSQSFENGESLIKKLLIINNLDEFEVETDRIFGEYKLII